MIAQFHHRGWHYALLAATAGLIFFPNLGGATLWDVDEGRNATCANEMREAGNWIVPTFNGNLRVEKPVLLYWLQILSYELFGVTEFAARFPSALAALATVLLTYELTRSMFTRTTGLFAGVIVATTPMLCGAARFANPDALLNCFSVATLTVFWFGLESRRWWWFALLGLLSGLAVLAKGPVGLVLPGAVVVAFSVWQRDWWIAWDRRWLIAATCFFWTALPWYVWVGIETKGEFLVGFLWRHNVERGITAMENHGGFPGYYLVILVVGAMPWSIFLLGSWWFGFWSSIAQPWSRVRGWWSFAAESEHLGRVAAYRLLTCWIAVYLVFFSVAVTKLPNYVLPVVAPCAILIACLLRRWHAGRLALPTWFLLAGTACLFLIGAAFVGGLAIVGGIGEFALMRGQFFRGLEMWAVVGVVPILAAIVGLRFVQKRQSGRFILSMSASAVLLLAPLAAFGSVIFNRYKAPQALVEHAELLRRDEDIRIACLRMDHLPSLNFYVQRNIEHLHDDKDVARALSYRVPVYLFMPAEEWERLPLATRNAARMLGRQYDMYHRGDMVLVTNR